MKTKRITKKLFSLLLAVLMSLSVFSIGIFTASAWTNYFVTGDDFGGFSATNHTYPINKTYDSTSGKYYATVNLVNGHYFKLNANDALYGPSADTDLNVGSAKVKVTNGGSGAFKFTGSTGSYKLCIDLTNGNDNSPYVWLESAGTTSAAWKLIGPLSGAGWVDTYKTAGTAFVKESSNVFYAPVTVTSTSKHFRFINNSDQQFGPGNGDKDIVSNTSSTNAAAATESKNGAFYISKEGTYRVYINTASASSPKVWAVAQAATTHKVTFTQPANGTIKVNGSSKSPVTVAKGDDYAVTITANTGYERDTFTVGGVARRGTSYTGTMGDTDVAVTASFKAKTYTITQKSSAGGSVTVPSTAAYGSTVTVTVNPDDGYACTKVEYQTGKSATKVNDTTYTFKMPASNVRVEVTFTSTNTDPTETTKPAGETISDLKLRFKGTSLSYLTPYVTLTDAEGNVLVDHVAMTRKTTDGYIGTYIRGTYKFYWYEYTLPTVTTGNNYTLRFTTSKSNMDASATTDFTSCPSDHIMYFGVDNLQTGTTLVNLTSNPTARQCFRSSVNMFTNVTSTYDPTTNTQLAQVNLLESSGGYATYNLGDVNKDGKINVLDVTEAQLMLAGFGEESEQTATLADFDVNGTANIFDVSYIQMYIAKLL